MILFLVFLSVAVHCSVNYSAAGASFTWPNLVIDNIAAAPLAAPPAAPFQIIEDVAPYSLRGYYNYTGVSSQVPTSPI